MDDGDRVDRRIPGADLQAEPDRAGGGMKRRSFLRQVATWFCAVPAALFYGPSSAAGKTRRPRAVHGFVTFSRGPDMETIAHYWASEVQQQVLYSGEEWLRLVDSAERYLSFARVYVVSYVDDECRKLLQAFWNSNLVSWTYHPDTDRMVIASKWVQKQREDHESRAA